MEGEVVLLHDRLSALRGCAINEGYGVGSPDPLKGRE
jgi:hypothetical protein